MIRSVDELGDRKIEIDLTGPKGNALVLLGYAKKLAEQFGLDAEAISREMKAGDYEHLVAVFEKHFGDHVDLFR